MAKILLIEDDQALCEVYQEIFTEAGFQIEIALDGLEGIHKAKASHPALILLDIVMPAMDGIEVLDILKSDPQTMGIPVVVLTNMPESGPEKQQAMDKGAVYYMMKSGTNPKSMTALVASLLEEKS